MKIKLKKNQNNKKKDDKGMQSGDNETKLIVSEGNKQKEKDNKKTESVNAAVKFTDGQVISKDEILKELGALEGQYPQKMSLNDLIMFLSMKHAYEKVITEEARQIKLDQDDKYKESLKGRENAVCRFAFLEEQASKLMTNSELKKFYNETWDKHMKGTNQVSLILIQVPSQKIAEQIKKEVKDEKDLNKIIKNLKDRGSNVAAMPLDDYPAQSFPPEILKEMKAKGLNSIIGPFQIQNVFTLFFVKSFHKAKKQEFSEDMIPQIKQLAAKEFANRYIASLIKQYKVEIYDLNGDKIDFNKNDNKGNENKSNIILQKIKETQVIAKIGDKQELTVQDLYKMFNIKSLSNEIFGALAMQLRITIEEVIRNAIKLCVQDKLLELEIEKTDYMNTNKMKKLCERIAKQHLRNAYFAKNVRITEADAKKEYNKYIKMMKPEDKDDNEISVKLVFYKTPEEAKKAIQECKTKPQEFKKQLNDKIGKKDRALDIGYVQRKDVPYEMWNVIKLCKPGTCVAQALPIDGDTYGFKDSKFAVAYIGDRRTIKLPTFQEKAYEFRKVAEKMQAIALCDNLLLEKVKSIGSKQYKLIPEEMRHKLLMVIIQTDAISATASSNDL